jgi:hypothetical protein
MTEIYLTKAIEVLFSGTNWSEVFHIFLALDSGVIYSFM